jgi:hypothetical protein
MDSFTHLGRGRSYGSVGAPISILVNGPVSTRRSGRESTSWACASARR